MPPSEVMMTSEVGVGVGSGVITSVGPGVAVGSSVGAGVSTGSSVGVAAETAAVAGLSDEAGVTEGVAVSVLGAVAGAPVLAAAVGVDVGAVAVAAAAEASGVTFSGVAASGVTTLGVAVAAGTFPVFSGAAVLPSPVPVEDTVAPSVTVSVTASVCASVAAGRSEAVPSVLPGTSVRGAGAPVSITAGVAVADPSGAAFLLLMTAKMIRPHSRAAAAIRQIIRTLRFIVFDFRFSIVIAGRSSFAAAR